MTDKHGAYQVDRLIWRFQKSGGEGRFTKPFTGFPADVQERLRRLSRMREAEIPALAYFASDDDWVLLTSMRVIYSRPSQGASIELNEIKDATVRTGSLFESGSLGKSGLNRLTIVTGTAELDIKLEPGLPFSGFWNVLKMIAARNSRRQNSL